MHYYRLGSKKNIFSGPSLPLKKKKRDLLLRWPANWDAMFFVVFFSRKEASLCLYFDKHGINWKWLNLFNFYLKNSLHVWIQIKDFLLEIWIQICLQIYSRRCAAPGLQSVRIQDSKVWDPGLQSVRLKKHQKVGFRSTVLTLPGVRSQWCKVGLWLCLSLILLCVYAINSESPSSKPNNKESDRQNCINIHNNL